MSHTPHIRHTVDNLASSMEPTGGWAGGQASRPTLRAGEGQIDKCGEKNVDIAAISWDAVRPRTYRALCCSCLSASCAAVVIANRIVPISVQYGPSATPTAAGWRPYLLHHHPHREPWCVDYACVLLPLSPLSLSLSLRLPDSVDQSDRGA
ncbi:hypothetical protein D915_000160 [Fasciola hepatica]|uniref:Uncharacterized protein n=1 Tax=Fasciola hepatica TaxID=6192 RepID=A0A4E0S0K2_FASHE|nr:hypothetical protein D915_000160 [Fasciola hepatica]